MEVGDKVVIFTENAYDIPKGTVAYVYETGYGGSMLTSCINRSVPMHTIDGEGLNLKFNLFFPAVSFKTCKGGLGSFLRSHGL